MCISHKECSLTKSRSAGRWYDELHDIILAAVTSAKYLGVHISSKLAWNTHVDITVKKAT